MPACQDLVASPQITAAMGVSPALRAALKVVEKMEASLLRQSYASASVDDASIRDALVATRDEAQRFFADTTEAAKRAIKQDTATAVTSIQPATAS